MKKLIALALVVCMVLSMMVLGASAENPFVCTHGRHDRHFVPKGYINYEGSNSIAFYGTIYKWDDDAGAFVVDVELTPSSDLYNFAHGGGSEDHFPLTPGLSNAQILNSVFWEDEMGFLLCTGDISPAASAPEAKPQPKTGVMDTLPLWFGVMAVSACAYILTSKKRGF